VKQLTRNNFRVGWGKFTVTRTSYDALVAELLKKPFPTLWTRQDFSREFGIVGTGRLSRLSVALRLAGVWRSDPLWITDPVTKKRIPLRYWRLLRTTMPKHLRTRTDLRHEHDRQWNYVREHRESIERLQHMTQYLAQSVA
jgi:hypothetical protein